MHDPLWALLSQTPGALTFAAAAGVLLSPGAFPGGAAPFLVGLVATLVLARLAKLLTARLSDRAPWAMRPRVADMPPSPGMPSSHVSIMAFAVVALCADTRGAPRRVAAAAVLGALALLVAVARVVTDCHTPLQVVVGAVFGAALGVAYVRLCQHLANR